MFAGITIRHQESLSNEKVFLSAGHLFFLALLIGSSEFPCFVQVLANLIVLNILLALIIDTALAVREEPRGGFPPPDGVER